MIKGVEIHPLKQIPDERGKIMHMLRSDDPYFERFGEIYFSMVYPGVVKGWHLHRLMTRVKRGLIRVDADEVTYPAHIILRYEIERPLIEGEIEPEDVPALWDAKMMELLGVDTRGNYTDGPLQDVHWPESLFGYFPCYSLGAMYAAQWFAAMRRAMPDLDERIGRGELSAVFDWLRDHIWSQGSRWTTDELALRASGEVLNPAHFKAHLEARYLD